MPGNFCVTDPKFFHGGGHFWGGKALKLLFSEPNVHGLLIFSKTWKVKSKQFDTKFSRGLSKNVFWLFSIKVEYMMTRDRISWGGVVMTWGCAFIQVKFLEKCHFLHRKFQNFPLILNQFGPKILLSKTSWQFFNFNQFCQQCHELTIFEKISKIVCFVRFFSEIILCYSMLLYNNWAQYDQWIHKFLAQNGQRKLF